jgi:FtsH-binding integral membrane protein
MFAALGLIFVTASSALGILTMNLFTFICGNLLSISIAYGLKKFTNGMELVVLAALGTAATTAGATMYALTTKRNYLGMGGTLFAVLIGVIAIGILNMFLQLPILHVLLSAVVVVLFTLYIIYDVQNIVAGGETNYIIAATNLYLNILNIFTALLDLLFAFLGDD